MKGNTYRVYGIQGFKVRGLGGRVRDREEVRNRERVRVRVRVTGC